ncbi:hypothetical protein G6F43_009818 [Rhizopus delemar]|nr:hypothetical protein G6F43_009818 [Rhizopus delemar]
MERSNVVKIVPYVYQYICQGVSVWPQGPAFTEERKRIVDETFLPLKHLIPTRVTLTSLSESPNNFIPCLLSILSEYEIEHSNHRAYDVRRLPLPRLFSLSPTPGMYWRFINISASALASFIKETRPQGFQNQLDMYYRVFNFKKLRLSMDDLTPNENNKILFGNTIKSDGFSVDFVFYRKKRMNNGSDVELTLEDFNYEEVHNQYNPMFLDPGRKSLFTAVVGVDSAKQIRKASVKEYYHLTGSTVYSKKLELKKKCSGINTIESQIPTPKTAAVESYDQYVKYMLTHLDKLLDFYGKDTAHHRFQLYQGRQRAPEMLANMLTHGTAKYNRSRRKRKKKKKGKNDKKKGKNDKKKDEGLSLRTDEKKLKWRPLPFQENKEKCPLVVFGAGVFGKDMVKMKGLRCGVVGKLFATLKKREAAGELIVVTIDEFKTSKTCSSCFFDDLKVVKTPGFKGKGVLGCCKCKKVWQRDVNAATNMMTISKPTGNNSLNRLLYKSKPVQIDEQAFWEIVKSFIHDKVSPPKKATDDDLTTWYSKFSDFSKMDNGISNDKGT